MTLADQFRAVRHTCYQRDFGYQMQILRNWISPVITMVGTVSRNAPISCRYVGESPTSFVFINVFA